MPRIFGKGEALALDSHPPENNPFFASAYISGDVKMFRNENRFKDNMCVMYKSVDDLIQKNKSLIGRTKVSNYSNSNLQKKIF